MLKIGKYGLKGFASAYRMIASRGPALSSAVKAHFTKSPEQKQAVVKALGAWSNRMPNAAQVAQYVKANPLNSLVLLITAAETADFAYSLVAEDPELELALTQISPADNIKSVGLPDGEYNDKQTAAIEAIAKTREQLQELPVSALLRFKDEVEVVKELEAMLPGDTIQARRELLVKLVKVCSFDQSVFVARELLDELGA